MTQFHEGGQMQISVNFTNIHNGLPNGAQFTVHLCNLDPQDIQQRALDFINIIHADDKAAGIPESRYVWLDSFGASRIEIIKVIRQYFDHGLKEAKEVTDRLTDTGRPTLVTDCSVEISHAQRFICAVYNSGGVAHLGDKDAS